MTEHEQTARELLAAEYAKDGHLAFALEIKRGNLNRVGMGNAIRAIIAALATPAPEVESDWFAGKVDADGNDLVTMTGDDLRQMIASAFSSGCYAVHHNHQEDRDPDFTEAGLDYADGVHPASTLSKTETVPSPAQGDVEKLIDGCKS